MLAKVRQILGRYKTKVLRPAEPTKEGYVKKENPR